MPSASTRLTVTSLYCLPLIVLKSSARPSDADKTNIASAVSTYFTGGFCVFCSPHCNDKMECAVIMLNQRAASNAVDCATFWSRSHRAVIPAYDSADNVIETHEHGGDFKEP